MAAVEAAGACLVLAGRYVFLARRRVLRWLAFGLLILAPVMVLVIFARHHILWVGVVSLVLVALAIVTTRLPSSEAGSERGSGLLLVPC